MVRRATGAPVINTAVILALLSVRGGRAFTASHARSCSNARGACTSAAAFASSPRGCGPVLQQQWGDNKHNSNSNANSYLHHRHRHRHHHRNISINNTSISAAFSTHLCPPVEASARRRARRYAATSSSTSTPLMSHPPSFSTLPSKRHRNTFLSLSPPPPPPPPPPTSSFPEDPTAPPGPRRGSDLSSGAALAGRAEDAEEGPLALVLLNTKGDDEAKHLLRRLWAGAALRVCADGAANRLHDSFDGDLPGERERFVPDVIVGDLDSLRPEVSAFYEALGSEVKLVEDQDYNDFEKCLIEVEVRLSPTPKAAPPATATAASSELIIPGEGGGAGSPSSPPRATPTTAAGAAGAAGAAAAAGTAATTTATAATTAAAAATEVVAAAAAATSGPHPICCPATVVGLGAFGGRFDHEMAGISLLHAYTSRFSRLVLMGSENVAFLLQPGLSHVVEPDPRFEGPTVGLIPVGGACRSVNTEGLKWNLEGGCLEFGVLVSSSNCVVAEEVRVTTDAPLVWTAEFRAAEWIETLDR